MQAINDNKRRKIESLQALRALAMFGVILSHIGIPRLAYWGHWGVSIFFVLSGYLMVYSHNNDCVSGSVYTNLKYAYKRMLKLYPIHIIMMLAMILLWFTGSGVEWKWDSYPINKILINLLLLQDWIPTNPEINSPTWFISALLFCYMIFPLYNPNKGKDSSGKEIMLLVTLEVIIQVTFIQSIGQRISNETLDITHWFTYYCPMMRAFDFLIGCNLFVWQKHGGRLRPLYMYLVCVLGVIMNNIPILWGQWYRDMVIYILPSCSIVYLMSNEDSVIARVFTNKITVWLGDVSNNVFLIHMVVFSYLDSIINFLCGRYDYRWIPYIKGSVGVAITVIISFAVNKYSYKIGTARKV